MQRFIINNIQRELWKYNQVYPNDTSYNIVSLMEIKGKLNYERFLTVNRTIISKEKIFCTKFVEEDDNVYQVYEPNMEPDVKIIDLSTIKNEQEAMNKVNEYAEKKKKERISLEKGPLIKIRLLTLKNEKSYFLFDVAHIIFDLFSGYEYCSRIEYLYNSDCSSYEQMSDEYQEKYHKEKSIEYLGDREITKKNEKAYSYFKKELQEFDTLSIPSISEKRDEKGCISGKNEYFSINREEIEQIRMYIKDNNISDYTFYLSVYIVLIHKATNEMKFVVGVPVANRRTKAHRSVLGFYSNMLPMVIDLNDITSFAELCRVVYRKVFSLLRYQDFNLSSLVDSGINTRINNAFTYYDKAGVFKLNGCEITRNRIIETDTAQYGCFCFIEKDSEDIRVSFEAGETFKNYNIEVCIYSILQSILFKKIDEISNMTLLPISNIKKIYEHVNNYQPAIHGDNIVSRFKRICSQYPKHIALSYKKETMTYEKLDILSDKVGEYLRESYYATDSIAISMRYSLNLIVGILGILKSGKAYVPIDIDAPDERYHYILSTNNIPLLCDERKKIDDFSGKYIIMNELMEKVKNIQLSGNVMEINPSHVAYVIYTSGTTGKPKGVKVMHKNLISLLDATQPKFNFNENDVWTLFHSYGFDFSVWEIFGCLLSGGKLVIVNPTIRKSPQEFYKVLKDEKVTVLNQTPTAFNGLVMEEQYSNYDENKLFLRLVIFGGEALDFAALKEWVKKHPLSQVKLVNMYGITETTVHVTYYELTDTDIEQETSSVIGKPLENLFVYIVNQDCNVVDYGCSGELLVGGDGVSLGYRGNNELTQKRYVTLNLDGKEKLYYHSGDLCVLRKDDNILYKGRIDNQIQLHGFRIELGEVERAFSVIPEIQKCAVSLYRFSSQDERIIAYVVARDKINVSDIKERLKKRLPYYMIPSLIVRVPKIKATINGKVDYKLLSQYVKMTDNKETKSHDNIEDTIADMIADILKMDDFDYDSNLFDIGFNSIQLTDLYYKIKNEFELEKLDMTDMFQYTTINSLAKYIQSIL